MRIPLQQPALRKEANEEVVVEVEPPQLSSYAAHILSTDSSRLVVQLDDSLEQLLSKYLPGSGLKHDSILQSGALLLAQTQAAEGQDTQVGWEVSEALLDSESFAKKESPVGYFVQHHSWEHHWIIEEFGAIILGGNL